MQTVVVKPYDYLGGQEGIGSKGGYHNYEVHFPELWKFECVQRWLRKKQPNTRAEYLKGFNTELYRGLQTRATTDSVILSLVAGSQVLRFRRQRFGTPS